MQSDSEEMPPAALCVAVPPLDGDVVVLPVDIGDVPGTAVDPGSVPGTAVDPGSAVLPVDVSVLVPPGVSGLVIGDCSMGATPPGAVGFG